MTLEAHSHVLLVARFEDGHGSEGTGSHGDVWQLVSGTVGVDSEELGSSDVHTADNKVCSDMSLVAAMLEKRR